MSIESAVAANTTTTIRIADFEPLGIDEIQERFDFTPTGGMYALDWWRYCYARHGLYEYPTQEYVAGLAGYIGSRVAELTQRRTEPIKVLEVGAGEGVLSALLARTLSASGIDCECIASDDGSWERIRHFDADVQPLDYRQALYEYNPSIVLGAWLPADWTPGLRGWPSVQEYILIGRTTPPNLPGTLATWGIRLNGKGEYVPIAEPEYQRQGFTRRNLDYLRKFQINYAAITTDMKSSETVSFRRDERTSAVAP